MNRHCGLSGQGARPERVKQPRPETQRPRRPGSKLWRHQGVTFTLDELVALRKRQVVAQVVRHD
tara:strand:- start:139 stop:330 length:192 start_codon:yes stop_codon:yes gene_type:complete|eukprot:scaffold48855_cov42-Phaeocystis_antarctica.AAC.2